jgi:protein-disulfide isomerase
VIASAGEPRFVRDKSVGVAFSANLRRGAAIRMQLMREIWFALLATIILTTAEPALAQTAAPPPLVAPGQTSVDPLALTADDQILGNPDAPITIIEYGSLTCPHCAAFDAEVLPKLKEKWFASGRAKLVFRPFPRDEVDLHASSVALCAPPDRFYAFIDAIFASQQQWTAASDPKAALARIGLLGGVSKTKFDACYDDKAIADKLLASRLVATQQLGISSTPTFFINGKKYDGQPTLDGLEVVLSKLMS